MNGPDHYRAAEHALTIVNASGETATEDDQDRALLMAMAQVHATLAVAAAINEQHRDGAWLVVR